MCAVNHMLSHSGVNSGDFPLINVAIDTSSAFRNPTPNEKEYRSPFEKIQGQITLVNLSSILIPCNWDNPIYYNSHSFLMIKLRDMCSVLQTVMNTVHQE